jgi:predicted regulator of Ras-like GTPase activity (Roadblock/LC7/MglB family)
MHDLVFDGEDHARFDTALSQFVSATGALSVLLVNRSGRIIATRGKVEQVDPTMLGALVAGSFSSIMTILAMIGDQSAASGRRKRMQISLPSGNRYIHISLVDENTFLVVIFDRSTNLATIKETINKLKDYLLQPLQTFYAKMQSDPEINLDIASS